MKRFISKKGIVLMSIPLLFGLVGLKTHDYFFKRVADTLKDRPPKIEEVVLKKIGQNRVFISAKTYDARISTQFEVEEQGQKILLKDNGTEVDERANDRVFSGTLQLDEEMLWKVFDQKVASVENTGMQKVVNFDERQITGQLSLQDLRTELVAKKADFVAGNAITLKGSFGLMSKAFPYTQSQNKKDTYSSFQQKSLLVTDLSVVEDTSRTYNPCTNVGNPNGVWTFGFLMREMANNPATGIPAELFTEDWMLSFLSTHVINTDVVNARPNINSVLSAWPRLPSGDLDISKAPFKLLGIVNRFDLRDNPGYGGGGNGGEGRFVFGFLDSTCNPLAATVIFEYGVPLSDCLTLKDYAQDWVNLSTMAFGSAYNDSLQVLTDKFSRRNLTANINNNKSSINQVRTNEFLQFPWELREFHIEITADDGVPGPSTNLLQTVTTKNEPMLVHNSSPFLTSYVSSLGLPGIPVPFPLLPNVSPMPTSFGGTNLLAGHSVNNPTVWNGSPGTLGSEERFALSLNTCSGCHTSETGTGFLHLGTVGFGTVSPLSGFLTGTSVTDPVNTTITRNFDDLQRRENDLLSFLSTPCRTGLGVFLADGFVLSGMLSVSAEDGGIVEVPRGAGGSILFSGLLSPVAPLTH